MKYEECKTCHQYAWAPDHRCKPVFLAWAPSDGETEADARQLRAVDHEEAAAGWAAEDDVDSASYRIVKGDDIIVHVRALTGGDVLRFVVSGEAVPQYYARQAEEEEAPDASR